MTEQLKIIISAEIGKLKQAVAEAQSEFKELTSEAQGSGGKIDAAMAKAGSAVASATKKMAVGIAAVGTALLTTAVATQEYREDIAKLQTAFESAGQSTQTAETAYKNFYKLIGESDTAVEASQQLALLANNEKEVEQWAYLAGGAMARFGDALPIETWAEGAQETLHLKEATGGYLQALEGMGANVDEFNAGLQACTTEEEAQAYMLEYTNGLLGESAELYAKNTEQLQAQREAQLQLQQGLAGVGEAMSPIMTELMKFAGEILLMIAPYLENFANAILPTLQTVLDGIASALQTAFEWASQHQTLLMVIGGIIATVVVALGLYNAVAAIKTAMDAAQVTSLTALIAAQLASAAATLVALAPYLLIAAAIAAVIAIIVLCVKHWDEIKAKVVEVAEKIKAKVQEMVDKVVNFFGGLKDKVQQKVDSLKQMASDKFEAIKSAITSKIQSARDTVSSVFDSIKSKIKSKIDGAKDAVKSAIDKIKGFFKFSWSLPKLKLPKISIKGKFSLSPPSAPKFSISWNKLGGVFDNPALFTYGNSLQGLGEDGAEAVVPLEKNTKWLDKIADKIAAKQGNVPIVLEVDGKTFAQVSIDSINALTRQRGNLGLNLI